MLKTAPNPIDVQDLQFKLHCRIKVFDNEENVAFARHCSLVACASRFGLIFVGSNSLIVQAIQLKHIEKLTKSDGDKADYPRRTLLLPSPPSHLSVNCEHTVLAIVVEKNGCPCALFYDVKSFWQKDIVQVGEVRLSPTPGVYVRETNWNPALGSIFTACKSDGSLGIYEIKQTGVDINELPAAAGATCFCWSPKGKQIAVGSRDGKITQLKPDLKAVKVINAPPLKEPHSLLSLQWVSNYQFIGTFQPINPDNQAVFIVVDAPKTGDPTYINYDDICYSNGNARPVQFYMILLQSWNIVMAASSNSMEVGILGNTGECWNQWIMGDAARAELPLSAKRQETLPIGCALDIGSTQPIPWGESTLPPAPLLLLFSHHGTLCCFNVINLKPGIPSLCTPPDTINDTSGLQHFVIGGVEQKSNNPINELSKIGQQSTQLFNVEKPASTFINTTPTILKVPPQVTTVAQGLNPSQTQPVNLFGGQATLSPITQGNKSAPTFMPQYQSTIPSPLNNPSKTVNAANVQILPSTAAPSHMFSKPVASVVSNLTSNNASKPSQPEPNEDFNKEVVNIDAKAEEEAEKVFGQMVKEECIFLESEVKAVLHQGKKLKFNLGSDADKTKIVENTKALEDFFHEVKEICVTQNAEVHILKQNLLQSWAWYEEAKSRHLASEDEAMMLLIRAQPLDSASEKQLADIQHTSYYLESQISQAHAALDEQWENFQDYCKKTHKLQIPTMEMIFQTMVKQNAILRKQSYILKDISSRLKQKSRSALGPSLLIAIKDAKDLPDELKRLRMNPEDIYQIRHEQVVKRMKNFTKKKADTLRSFLKKREYPHVSAVKPQLSTSVIQTSPSSKLRQSSLWTLKTPPHGREISGKKLDFVQSTPIPTIPKSEPFTSEVQSSTPIEGLQNFALKFEAKNFSNLSEKTFAPLTKNLIASSPHSAFVSTSLGSSTSTVTSSSSKPIFLGLSSVTTTTPTMAKTVPSFVVATTPASQPISANLSKPFSFVNVSASSASSQENITLSKPSVSLFSSSGTKPTSPFNVDSKPSLFEMTDVKNAAAKPTTSVFNIASTRPTASTVSSFNATQSAKFATSTTNNSNSVISTKTVPTSLPFSSTASPTASVAPSFSFGVSSASSIFATANQKSSESVTNKPFVFSSKTLIPATSATQNLITQQTTTATNSQVASFGGTAATAAKVTNVSQSSLFTTPLVANNLQNVAVSSSIFTSGQTVLTPKASTTITATSAQPSIFSSTVTTTAAQSSILSLAGTKPSLFTSVTSVAESTSQAASTVTTAGTAITTSVVAVVSPITAANTSTSSSVVTASASDQSAAGKQNIFSSIVNSTGSSSTVPSAATGLTFGGTVSNKPSVFSSTEIIASKPLLFGSSSGSSVTSLGGPTTTTSSLFGVGPSTTTGLGISTPTTQSSIFGAVSCTPATGFVTSTTTTTQSSIFGVAATTSTSSFGISSTSTTKSPIFGSGSPTLATDLGNAAASTTQSSLFGTTPSTVTTFGSSAPSTTQSSIFAPASTSATGFAASTTSTTQPSVFGSVSSTSTAFGNAVSTTQPSIFSTPPSTSTPSLFGSPAPSTTQSIFGSAAANQSSVFGNAVSSAAPQSIFGNPPASVTTQSSQGFGIFGDGAQKSSVFGNPTTTQSSIFGSGNQSSVFGNTTSTQSSVFGNTASTQSSVFGNTTNTQSSVFGQNQQSNTFGQPSVFGASGSSFGNSSVFGASAPSFGQSTGSIFGNTPSTTTGSIFGGTATTGNTFASSGSVFGTPVSSAPSPFGSGSVFASTSTQPSSFSAGTNTGSFGFGSLSVGSVATTSSSSFGSSSTPNPFGSDNKSVFGSPAVSSSNPVFGSNTGSVFGSSSSGFGSGFGNQSPFGQQSVFGQSSFGNTSFGQTPSGPFSGGSSGGVGQTGFGTATSFQKPGGFGSSPVFGGSPSFGSAPSFGGAPAFGSPPSFGSSPKVFGSASPGFGAAAANQSAGFGNLANQPTVGFGNLAQQAANATTPGTAFSGNSSFSSWR